MELSEFQRPLNIKKIKDDNKLEEILIIEEYKKIMFNELSETVDKLSTAFKEDFYIHGKRLKNNQYLILVKFIKTSPQNCINEDVLFQIILLKEFPQTSPQIYCCSNYCYPNIYDQRDLYISIMNTPWTASSKLDEIIGKIPIFVNRTVFNQINKILAYYGNYHIDKYYNINDFIMNKENFIFKVKVDLNSNGIEKKEIEDEKVNKSRFNSNVFNNNDLNNNARHFIVVSELSIILLEINNDHKAICKLLMCSSLNDCTLIKIKSSLNTVPKIGILLNSFEFIKYLEITLFDSVKEQFFVSLIEKRQDGLRKDFNLIYEDLYFKRDQRIYSNNIYSIEYFKEEISKYQQSDKNSDKLKFHSFNEKSITLKDFVEDREFNKIIEETKPKNTLKFSNKKSSSNVQDIEKLDKENEFEDFFLLKEDTYSTLVTEEIKKTNKNADPFREDIENNVNESNFIYHKTANNDYSIKKYFKLNKSQVMNCYFITYPDELIKLKGILKIKKEIFKNLFDQESVFAKPNSDIISKEIIYIYQILIEAFSFLDRSRELKEHLQEMNEFIYSFKLNK